MLVVRTEREPYYVNEETGEIGRRDSMPSGQWNDELPTCVICEVVGCSHCLSYCKTCSGDVCSDCECNHDNWGA